MILCVSMCVSLSAIYRMYVLDDSVYRFRTIQTIHSESGRYAPARKATLMPEKLTFARSCPSPTLHPFRLKANGILWSAMRVSPVGFAFEEVVTHVRQSLTPDLLEVVDRFCEKFPCCVDFLAVKGAW